ncbi:Uncharacterised protein [Vibrio cholerae]|nr:Uncharacterised protein [Vibrio cholerae]
MIETRAVVFSSTSQLLPKPGIAWRIICGNKIRRKLMAALMP